MKKLFAVALCAGLAGTAGAQVPQLGIKGGLNIATVSGSSASPTTRLSGHGGLLVHVHLTDNIAFQPEVVFSGQGFKATSGGREYTFALDYLNVPFMLQYMFNGGFRVEAGPQVGLLLSAHTKDDQGSSNTKSIYKQADFGLGFGLSYLSSSGLGLGARFNLGLSDITKRPQDENLMNRVGQVSVFYQFNNTSGRRPR